MIIIFFKDDSLFYTDFYAVYSFLFSDTLFDLLFNLDTVEQMRFYMISRGPSSLLL
jgi:hypothetical protein